MSAGPDQVALIYGAICAVFAGVAAFVPIGTTWTAPGYWRYMVVIFIPCTIYLALRAALKGNLAATICCWVMTKVAGF